MPNSAFPIAFSGNPLWRLAEKRDEYGKEILNFDPREWRAWLAFKAKIGAADPLQVAHEWLAGRPAITPTMTVAEAVTKYLALRAGDGLAPSSMRQIKKKLGRLTNAHGSSQLGAVTTDDVRAWLAGLEFEPWTVKDHLKVVSTFWRRARLEKWCAEDITEPITPPKIEAEEINILTVAETAKLFEKNAGLPVVGRLALEAFGGLRFSSAARLLDADLKRSQKGIELPGRRHKSGRRHYIDGMPANLWAWIKATPAACWTMTERQYLEAKHDAFVRAGVTSTQNCLRHSFGTYHVAAFKDAGKTAVLMQHTSPVMLYRHYKGNATRKDGVAYFKILPG